MYKKYPSTATPSHFNYQIKYKDSKVTKPLNEDGIDVITYLFHPATLEVNGLKKPVKKGFQITRFPAKPGKVTINLSRDGKVFIKMAPHEWITSSPYRTDRLTYMFSSQYSEYAELIDKNGNFPISNEYALDSKGIPNWKNRISNSSK